MGLVSAEEELRIKDLAKIEAALLWGVFILRVQLVPELAQEVAGVHGHELLPKYPVHVVHVTRMGIEAVMDAHEAQALLYHPVDRQHLDEALVEDVQAQTPTGLRDLAISVPWGSVSSTAPWTTTLNSSCRAYSLSCSALSFRTSW